jgi:hypothetical protein
MLRAKAARVDNLPAKGGSVSVLIFLVIRALHVLLAAFWIGATLFVAMILMPAIRRMEAAGNPVLIGIHRGGLTPFMAALGGLTVLSGIWLYWHFTGGFDPVVSASRAGMAFGTGGAAGIVAVIIGGAVIGRSWVKMSAAAAEVPQLADGLAKAAKLQVVESLRQRIVNATAVVLALQIVALTLMAIGHYI